MTSGLETKRAYSYFGASMICDLLDHLTQLCTALGPTQRLTRQAEAEKQLRGNWLAKVQMKNMVIDTVLSGCKIQH